MKITSRMIIKALRIFEVADDNASTKELKKLEMHDEESFVRASFTFKQSRYALLYGINVSEDVVSELWPKLDENAIALKSPLDPTELVIPFQGKYLMLFHIDSGKQRLDIFLSTEFDPSISRSLWQKYIKAGYVSVNGVVISSPKSEVSLADKISVQIPESTSKKLNMPIIYEDDDVIVVNKPSGVLTHAKGGLHDEMTLADFIRPHTSFNTDTDRPGIVHRLDRDTSGVIISARNKASADFLQKQFADRKVGKVYIAELDGAPKHPEAKIDLPIARNPAKPSTFRVDANGKPAETIYRVLDEKQGRSLVKLEPTTGRTHQLRVHMAYLSTPIHGDIVYGKKSKRLALHAYQLKLTLPSGEEKTFEAPIPDGFSDTFKDIVI